MPFVPPPALPPWLTAELPHDRRGYELERGLDAGRSLHLIDDGPRDAPVVVMLHGNPTWSFLWRKVIAALPGRRCIAPDLLGLGLSYKLPKLADHSVERHVDAIAELLDALDLGRYVLVGQDWGGALLPSIAARAPERVAGIVLANTTVVVPKDLSRSTAFHRFARMPLVAEFAFQTLGLAHRMLWTAQGDFRSLRSGVEARAYRWPLRNRRERAAPLALARMVPSTPDHPSVAPLRQGQAWIESFEGPMALVWGTRDPVLGRALKKHERTFPRAPVTLTKAGHFLQEQVPGALAAAIEDVLERAD
ncbi:MAG: alpha/beta fold hydrolase [Myxococcota bacterium]